MNTTHLKPMRFGTRFGERDDEPTIAASQFCGFHAWTDICKKDHALNGHAIREQERLPTPEIDHKIDVDENDRRKFNEGKTRPRSMPEAQPKNYRTAMMERNTRHRTPCSS